MIYDLKYLLFCLFLVVTILIFLNDIKSKSVKPFEMIAAKTNLEESSLKVNATDNDAQKHTRNPDLIHIKEFILLYFFLTLSVFTHQVSLSIIKCHPPLKHHQQAFYMRFCFVTSKCQALV